MASVSSSAPSRGDARGLAGPTFTRGFFASDVPSDGYNLGSVTVNRGPNAMLFGVAQPSGVVDANVNHADTRRNQNKIEVRYGDNDSLRESINFNRVLVPAMFVALARPRSAEESRPPHAPL